MEHRINRTAVVTATRLLAAIVTVIAVTGTAEAIPAFARKYNQSCNTCHTRQPRLNWYGQRFLENGYQLPGTQDGGDTEKRLLSGLTLDDVGNFLAVRIRADVERFDFHETEATEANEDFNIQVPDVLNIFTAGTAMKNLGYFLEMEFNTREEHGGLIFERAFLVFSNLGGKRALNVKVGEMDPSFMFSFPTHRQQLNPVGPDAHSEEFPPEINRVPLLPLAFSAKFFGLTRGGEGDEGYAILPFEPMFFNHPSRTGAALYGRPGNKPLFYQLGVVQNPRADGENGFDGYGMLRWDIVQGSYMAANVSGFYYRSSDSAHLTINPGTGPVPFSAADWTRWGIGARVNIRAVDIYAAWVADRLDFELPSSGPPSRTEWDDTAWGFSLEADWLASERWLISGRYDVMDAGGLVRLPTGADGPVEDSAWLGLQGKFYWRPNVALYARSHFNLKSAGVSAPRNLRNALLFGVDMAF